jgi:hypothetical protein
MPAGIAPPPSPRAAFAQPMLRRTGDRTTFDRAAAYTGLRDWIVSRATDVEARWSIDATPSFLVNGKLHTGAISAAGFLTILAS